MRWIQRVRQRMRQRGTVGAFRRQAQRAGKTTAEFARKVLKNPARYAPKDRASGAVGVDVRPNS